MNQTPKKSARKQNDFKLIDISLPLYNGMITYPGNPELRMRPTRSGQKSLVFPSFLTEISMGSHTGTHVDSPSHVFPKGKAVDAIKLTQLVGNCRVLNMTHVKKAVMVSDLEKENIKKGERILVKTKNSISTKSFKEFYNDYIYLDGDAAEYLAKKNICLFGIDYLSVKQKGSLDHRPHTALLKKNIPIFEGLDLSKVKPGKYFFIGLPLKFIGIDGAPARAILMSK